MQAKLKKYSLLIILSIFFCPFISIAQKSAFDGLSDEKYRRALELFEKEKYVAAQKLFLEMASDPVNKNSLKKGNSEYFALVCAIELFNQDANELGERFLARNPESQWVNAAKFQLGKFEYTKKRYRPALEYFTKVEKGELNDDDRAECIFKTGYSWFMLDSLEKARKSFYEIKDIDTKYTSSAIYYYSHIAYSQKNYETAIAGFNRLRKDETFAPLVPYYISQCYYYQQKFDELLAYAPPLVDSVIESRVAEMARMIGDAYYKKNQLNEAIPYYERYFKKGKDFKPEDYYQAGYCYYMQSIYDKAAQMFEKSALSNSNVAQSSNYHLGDCYIKLNQKDKALLAFSAAAKMDYDPKIKEDAAFNYAVLTFELSNTPFNSAIKALNDYITKYPDSKRTDEAYNYLIAACVNTHNYQDALSYLGKVKVKDKNIKKAYQRAAFFKGLELFNNLQFNESLNMFDLSLKYSDSDPLIAARTYYWMAEANYRLKDIPTALDNYNLFVASNVASKTPEFKLVNYNIAYCWFNKKDFNAAQSNFTKYADNPKVKKDKTLTDTYNRLGDCSFIDSKYSEAIGFYTKSIELGLSDKDYAIYQKAFSLGLQGDHKKKISLLNQLLTSMPESGYCDDALYEIGRSNVSLQKTDDATKYFKKLNKDYPSSNLVRKSLLQLGLIEYNAERNTSAIEIYKKVVADFPGTQEAKSALTGIKNIYVEMNDIDSYLKYSETLGDFANVSSSEKDSLLYYAGENLYTKGDCKKANDNFKKYLEKYPEGNFTVNANFYKGECSLKSGETNDALNSFNFVIHKPYNNFTEPSLLEASKLNFDQKNFSAALLNFQKLDSIAEISENKTFAEVGIVKCSFALNDYKTSIEQSQKLIKSISLPQETERQVRFILAKSLSANGQDAEAIEQMKKLAKDVKNIEGAEAKFRVAEYYFKQNQQDKSQKEIFNFIDLNSPHQYWMAKAFMLLADIYHNKKDDFQASNTLQSIIDNYDNKDDGIIKEAIEKKSGFEKKTPVTETHDSI